MRGRERGEESSGYTVANEAKSPNYNHHKSVSSTSNSTPLCVCCRLKQVDIEFMKQLHEKVSVVVQHQSTRVVTLSRCLLTVCVVWVHSVQ